MRNNVDETPLQSLCVPSRDPERDKADKKTRQNGMNFDKPKNKFSSVGRLLQTIKHIRHIQRKQWPEVRQKLLHCSCCEKVCYQRRRKGFTDGILFWTSQPP